MSGRDGVLSVTLSGAGPSVLLLVESMNLLPAVKDVVLENAGGEPVEIVECGIELNQATFG